MWWPVYTLNTTIPITTLPAPHAKLALWQDPNGEPGRVRLVLRHRHLQPRPGHSSGRWNNQGRVNCDLYRLNLFVSICIRQMYQHINCKELLPLLYFSHIYSCIISQIILINAQSSEYPPYLMKALGLSVLIYSCACLVKLDRVSVWEKNLSFISSPVT
jgi:hypothetical protein